MTTWLRRPSACPGRVLAVLAACALLAACGPAGTHRHDAGATSDRPPAPSTVTASASAGQDGAADGTDQVVLSPVDGDGRPAGGWTVTADHSADTDVTCTPAQAAPAARSGNIYFCYPTAVTADTCWPSDRHTVVLCLVDPFGRGLAAFRTAGVAGPVAAPARPQPLGLELADGDHCRLRDGGAWSSPAGHPDWTGFYTCQHDGAVWAAADGGGVDTSAPTWTVHVGTDTGPLRTVDVTKALFVASAA